LDAAAVHDHHAGADAALELAAVLVHAEATHAHHGGADDVERLGHARGEGVVLERAHHRSVDVLLR
jgi:hypothetical protein